MVTDPGKPVTPSGSLAAGKALPRQPGTVRTPSRQHRPAILPASPAPLRTLPTVPLQEPLKGDFQGPHAANGQLSAPANERVVQCGPADFQAVSLDERQTAGRRMR